MAFLLVAARELAAADVALKRLLACVRADVGRQVVAATEGAHADAALEGLLAGVYTDVAGELVTAGEAAVAGLDRAGVGAFLGRRLARPVRVLALLDREQFEGAARLLVRHVERGRGHAGAVAARRGRQEVQRLALHDVRVRCAERALHIESVEVRHAGLAVRRHDRRPLVRRADRLGIDEVLRHVHGRLWNVQDRLAAGDRGIVALLGTAVVGRRLLGLEGADRHVRRRGRGRVAGRLHGTRLHRLRLGHAAGDRGGAVARLEVRRAAGERRRWCCVAVVHGGSVLLVNRGHLLGEGAAALAAGERILLLLLLLQERRHQFPLGVLNATWRHLLVALVEGLLRGDVRRVHRQVSLLAQLGLRQVAAGEQVEERREETARVADGPCRRVGRRCRRRRECAAVRDAVGRRQGRRHV